MERNVTSNEDFLQATVTMAIEVYMSYLFEQVLLHPSQFLLPLTVLGCLLYWLKSPFNRLPPKGQSMQVLELSGESASVETKVPSNVKSMPGPTPLPIVGNALSVLYDDNYLTLTKWAEQYGKMFMFYYGNQPQVVISDRKTAKQLMSTEVIGTGRTQSFAVKRALGICVFGTEGPMWDKLRKFEINAWKNLGVCTPALDTYITEEMAKLVDEINLLSDKETDLLLPMYKAVSNALGMLVFDQPFADAELQEMLGYNLGILGFFASPSVDLVNMFPAIRHLLPKNSGFAKLEAAADGYMLFLKNKIEKLKQLRQLQGIDVGELNEGGKPRTFAEAWINQMSEDTEVNEEHFLGVLMEQVFPSLEITVAFTWFLKILLTQPAALRDVVNEIRTLKDAGTSLTWENQDKFAILNATILESWRMARFSPCSFPRRAKEDCVVDGYFIPKDAKVFFLRYASTRDPTYFKEPQEFKPERFMGMSAATKSESKWYNPFGFGRRMCPAEKLAMMIVFQLATKLLGNFDFKVVTPSPNTLKNALEYTRRGFILTPYPFSVIPQPLSCTAA